MSNTATPALKAPRPEDVAADARIYLSDSALWIQKHWLEIAIAAGVGAVVVAVLLAIRSAGRKLCRDHAGSTSWRVIAGRAIDKTSVWFMVSLAAKLVSGYAAAPPAVSSTIDFLFTVVATVQVAIWAREVILGAIEHRAGDIEHGTIGSAIGIIRLLVTFVLFAIALLMILDNLGVNVTGLVAGLGIGGIAIGLAAKGIFDDLFAALAIIFDKPFRRGDSVKWDNTSGSIEAIGLKSTRLRSITGEQVIIANKNLLDKEVHNLARLARRRMTFAIGLTYETPSEVLERVPAILKEVTERHDKCIVVRCGLVSFGDSSVDFELQFDVASESYDEVFEARSRVGLAIMREFGDRGISFAYPTQTTYTAAPDGTLIMPYPQVQKVEVDDDHVIHRKPQAASGSR